MDLTGRQPLELVRQEIGHDGGAREGAVTLHQPNGAVLVVVHLWGQSRRAVQGPARTTPRRRRGSASAPHPRHHRKAGPLLAIIGESGSGKSTLLRLLLGLEAPDTGMASFAGREVAPGQTAVPPGNSLDPRMSVLDDIREPLECFRTRLCYSTTHIAREPGVNRSARTAD